MKLLTMHSSEKLTERLN